MRKKISVITLLSYDSEYLPKSIASYYDYVDEIIIGLDENRISWSKNPFTFEEDKLHKELQQLDGESKIKIIEGNFHNFDVALDNDNYERNFLKDYCSNEIIMSFDADEELLNAKEFFHKFIPIYQNYTDRDLLFKWVLPYKHVGEDTLVIANNDNSVFLGDIQGFCTNKNSNYTYCRWTDNRKQLLSPLCILHWSFCRKEDELNTKLNNFGHSDRTANDPFFEVWKNINETNYQNLRNFKTSGYGENQWEKLIKIPTRELKGWLTKATEKSY